MTRANSSRTRPARPSVLVAHPGAGLYGADRVTLETATALGARGWAVTVAVPTDGPLVPCLEEVGADVVLCPTPVLRNNRSR